MLNMRFTAGFETLIRSSFGFVSPRRILSPLSNTNSPMGDPTASPSVKRKHTKETVDVKLELLESKGGSVNDSFHFDGSR